MHPPWFLLELSTSSSDRLMIVSVIYGSYDDQMRRCNAPVELQAFFVGVIVLNVAVIMNEVAIVYVSMQGTILDTDARKHLPVLLYIQCALYLPEVCWTGLGTFWVSNKRHDCGIGLVIAVCVSVALQWTIMLLVFIAALVMFDPLGSHHGVDADDGNAASFTRQSTKQVCVLHNHVTEWQLYCSKHHCVSNLSAP